MGYKRGEVWFVAFPLEEDPDQFTNRPVIVLDEQILGVLSVKVTKHKPRENDKYDTPILYWQQAKLRFASTARISKTMILDRDAFLVKLGDLHPDDLKSIEEQYMKYVSEKI
jgi:mRNA-degrading endonuclease toxin of MazEF toxin-antitoxin module